MRALVKRIVDNRDQRSLAARARISRFKLFRQLLERLEKPIRILDIGGTVRFWEVMDFTQETGVQITLLNLSAPPTDHPNFTTLVGDATDLGLFPDREFDVVFSNSVIEHVGGRLHQASMAEEVRRVGKRYFIQTPNYYFPIEPHFLLPGFHWLPVPARVWLLRRFNLGWIKRTEDENEARQLVESICLLKRADLLALFPGGQLYEERYFGMVKSFIVYDGW